MSCYLQSYHKKILVCVLSEGICREEKKIMGFSYFPQNTSANICVGLVCSSSSSNTNKNFIKCFDTIFFLSLFSRAGKPPPGLHLDVVKGDKLIEVWKQGLMDLMYHVHRHQQQNIPHHFPHLFISISFLSCIHYLQISLFCSETMNEVTFRLRVL